MFNKLYPPILATRLPAFYQDDNDDLIFSIPFEHNRAVGAEDYRSIVMRLKTVQNDEVCFGSEILREDITDNTLNFVIIKSTYQINKSLWKVNLGQYYQLQIAYKSKDNLIGYYSSVGMIKFSSLPVLSIEGLETIRGANDNIYNYKGIYSQKDENGVWDSTEKAYEYRFVLSEINDENQVLKDTGWLLHDSSTDETYYESFDNFITFNEYPNGFKIQYMVKTTSSIIAKSPLYTINADTYIEVVGELSAKLNFDDGYVSIDKNLESMEGYLVRQENDDELIRVCDLNGEIEFKDMTVEQGKSYTYYLYNRNNDSYIRTEPAVIDFVDFEDIFLDDANGRQLKIRFNPSINSYKNTVLESKQDTIGGQFPIIYRNGNVSYREISISGLITMDMDENGLFMPIENDMPTVRNKTKFDKIPNENLIGKKFYKERIFREEVNKWLQNGEIKLFRSASEGNILVRVMNCNLTPYQGTSRLVYSFSANLVEEDEYNYENLLKYKFFKVEG